MPILMPTEWHGRPSGRFPCYGRVQHIQERASARRDRQAMDYRPGEVQVIRGKMPYVADKLVYIRILTPL